MRRLWDHEPPGGQQFETLRSMCNDWADSFKLLRAADSSGLDPGHARAAIEILRDLPESADRAVLLCTDLHAENVLAARREPWLVIDPNPFIGDPAYDPVQHMLNCDERLATDPAGLSQRMASLLELDAERVRLWLFARCVQSPSGTPPCASQPVDSRPDSGMPPIRALVAARRTWANESGCRQSRDGAAGGHRE